MSSKRSLTKARTKQIMSKASGMKPSAEDNNMLLLD